MTTRVIFVGAGQSNMAGFNNLPSPAPTYTNASKIYCYSQPLDNDTGWPCNPSNPSAGTWALATDPTHSQTSAGVSPLIALADRYITAKGDSSLEVGIVPCGWYGSRMNGEWAPIRQKYSAWYAMASRLKAAMAWGTVKGVLWAQGESEACDSTLLTNEAGQAFALQPDIWPKWHQGLYALIRETRAFVGLPTLPFIVTQLGNNPGDGHHPNWSNMQTAISFIPQDDPTIQVLSRSDLSTIADGAHFTSAAQIAYGVQAADKFIAMGA